MLIKTHLSITIFAILVFISSVEHKVWFVALALIATYIPDADSEFSSLGKKKGFRILQFFVRHRGIIHSFTFLFLVTFLLVMFFPVAGLGFFLGYGLHLLVDGFTVQGIVPFYPIRKRMSGSLKTGGVVETGVLVFFVLADIFLIVVMVF